MSKSVRERYLWVLNNTLNRVTKRVAHTRYGPFSVLRHVGRKSGAVYETPLILAPVEGGFVAELTYGPKVQWYRNIVAAGGCEVVVKGVTHRIDRIEPYPTEKGLRAFGFPAQTVLRLLRRREFRFLGEAT